MNSCHRFSRLICTTLLLGVTVLVHAQSKVDQTTSAGSAFGVGDRTIAVGFGLGLTYDYIKGTSVPLALVGIYDQGWKAGVGPGVVGLGGIIGYKSAHYEYGTSGLAARWSNLLVGARGSYHFPLGEGLEKVDVYGATMFGLRFSRYQNQYLTSTGEDVDYSRTRIAAGGALGARYDITGAIGAWVELGYDVALLKFGLHVNL